MTKYIPIIAENTGVRVQVAAAFLSVLCDVDIVLSDDSGVKVP